MVEECEKDKVSWAEGYRHVCECSMAAPSQGVTDMFMMVDEEIASLRNDLDKAVLERDNSKADLKFLRDMLAKAASVEKIIG